MWPILLRLLGLLHVRPQNEVGRQRRMISPLLRDSKSRKRNKSDQRPASHGGLLADLLDVNLRRLASLRFTF
jgi:hypothetical protein